MRGMPKAQKPNSRGSSRTKSAPRGHSKLVKRKPLAPQHPPQRGGVELDGSVPRARVRAGERLQRLQMRRRHDERAAIGQRFQNGLGQRGSLVGIGPRSQLIEEDEG